MKAYIENFLTSVSYLLLVRSRGVGAVLFLLSFVNISSGVLSLIAYLSAIFLARFIGISRQELLDGFYLYNSVLVGMGMGFLFEVSLLSAFFTIVASFFTLLLSYGLHALFASHFRLPILNVPFTLVIIIIYLASSRYGSLFVAKNIPPALLNFNELPLWISGFLKATGILIFLPYDLVGLAILVAMLLFSRINFFLMAAGYYGGTLFLMILKGSSYYAFTDVYSFNFILIALALGGLFLIPSVKSYTIALFGVLASVFVLDAVNVFWSSYSIPVFTIPFILVTLPILYVMVMSNSHLVTATFTKTPETNLEHYLNYSSRFNLMLPQPHLPFSGEWKVYQGFDDEWTHKGNWAYGMDFVIENRSDGKTFRNDGSRLDDYYCYNKPVLSPVSGQVVEICDEYKDNPPGTVDRQNNWGNYIIIESQWKYYVELSHFAEKSIVVKPGDRVSFGQIIGRCGNSGYSPQPHIHMQVQFLPQIGAPTVPFRYINAVSEGVYIGGNRSPRRGELVKPVTFSRGIERRLQLLIDDVIRFDYLKDSIHLKTATFKVKMAPDASMYIDDEEGGARLHFSSIDGIFAFYRFDGSMRSPLRLFLLALPRIPLTEESIAWTDTLSSLFIIEGGSMYTFPKSFCHRLFAAHGNYSLSEGTVVKGAVSVRRLWGARKFETRLMFSEYKGFESVMVTMNGHCYELIQKKA
jgi:urea transporter